MTKFIKGIRSRGFSAMAGIAILGATSVAAAVPTAPTGPVYISINGSEIITQTASAYGDNTWGVGFVKAIDLATVSTPNQAVTDTGMSVFNQSPGNHIYFMFYGLTSNGTTSGNLNSAGGHLDLYYSTKNLNFGTINASSRTGLSSFPTITDGTPLASFNFIPDVNPGDTTTTVSGTAPGTVTTSNQGASTGYLAQSPNDTGAWAGLLHTQYFLYNSNGAALQNPADIYLNTTFQPSTTFASTNAFQFSDPSQAAFVPEPSALLIFGVGLVALGFMSRRRFSSRG